MNAFRAALLAFAVAGGVWVAVAVPLRSLSAGGSKTAPPESSEPRHPYAGAEVGFYVKYRVVTDMGFMKLDKEVMTKVVQVLEDKVTIETVTRAPNAEDVKVLDTVSLSERPGKPAATATGTEKITVPAGDFDCTWFETETAGEGGKTVTRTWTSDEIMTHVIKIEIVAPKTKYTWELIDFFIGN
jgi:hypothetical protein